jgi:hypothetical protein
MHYTKGSRLPRYSVDLKKPPANPKLSCLTPVPIPWT